MAKVKGDAGEYEFTRAAYDELADLERQTGLKSGIILLPGEVKGIWRLVVSAHDPSGPLVEHPVCSWSGTWPNSVSQTFACFLYAACHRVVRMAEAWSATAEALGRGEPE